MHPQGIPGEQGERTMKVKASSFSVVIVLFLATAPTFGQQVKNLWIAQFTCEPKAAAAIASIQQSDLAAMQSVQDCQFSEANMETAV